jgi:pilus assembly protein TadC
LTQSNLFGNSIIDNLYTQVDYLREKRKMEVKGRISKIPVLISIISVLFFVPLLLILILGPVLLEYL